MFIKLTKIKKPALNTNFRIKNVTRGYCGLRWIWRRRKNNCCRKSGQKEYNVIVWGMSSQNYVTGIIIDFKGIM